MRSIITRATRLAAIFALLSAPLAMLSAQNNLGGGNRTESAVPDARVSATDPAGLLAFLKGAGLEGAKLIPQRNDDEKPIIEIENEGLTSFILFKDCNEAVAEFCETLVLSTSWDRETPMTGEAVAQANYDFRYISVWRDEEGDPFAQWAIYTGREGIPAPVFLNALRRYQTVVNEFWGVVFDDDEGAPAEESPQR